jgi:hypothetical protein
LTAADGLAKLNILWDSLTASEQKERKGAYDCAVKYIKNAAANGGLEAVDTRPKTCQEPTRKDPTARIDIEVNAGKAFVP